MNVEIMKCDTHNDWLDKQIEEHRKHMEEFYKNEPEKPCTLKDNDDIKKCPECGGDVHYHDLGWNDINEAEDYTIHCHKCGMYFLYNDYLEMDQL